MDTDTEARRAAERLRARLKGRMEELWQNPDFRAKLEEETAKVTKRNFRRYVKKAIAEAEDGK